MVTRDIDVELQSGLLVFSHDDFWEGNFEASRALFLRKK